MTDLTANEMQRRIRGSLNETAARFHPKVIVVEGLEAWGTFYSSLLDELREHRWLMDNDGWYRRRALHSMPHTKNCAALYPSSPA
jgi:hypothetical protein